MTPERFEHLLSLVGPLITKRQTRMKEPIDAAERLTLTIRYLASGDSQQSLSFSYRMGKSTVSSIINETLPAIWLALKDEYLRPPKTQDDWLNISQEFETTWNLPHCVGALDGKHIAMQCPRNSGSQYFNYKGYFSIVLLALCDANYNFTLLDIGQYGSNNDSGALANSEMGKAFEYGTINFPTASKLQGCKVDPLPYFIVGDEIFPLKPWLMRPYPGKNITEEKSIFNYRLSRARRVIENCFGILVARWRISRTPIIANVETVEKITQAACCLHNYLRQTDCATYCPAGFIDSFNNSGDILPGQWRCSNVSGDCNGGAIRALTPPRDCRYLNSAVNIREALKEYVNSDAGAVSWQWDYVRSRGPMN